MPTSEYLQRRRIEARLSEMENSREAFEEAQRIAARNLDLNSTWQASGFLEGLFLKADASISSTSTQNERKLTPAMPEKGKNKMESEEKSLMVDDLTIVTYLRSLNCKYSEVPRYIDGRVVFYFRPTDEAKKAFQDFHNGKATIDPRLFNQIRRNLKIQVSAAVKEALSDLAIKGGQKNE